MHHPRSSRSSAAPLSSRTAQALLLAVALLLAQWVGMLHRIEHAGGHLTPQAQSRLGSAHSSSPSVAHSCVVFDGAYLADLLPTNVVDFVAAGTAHVLPPASVFAFWHGLATRHFQPRAPPAA